MSAYAEQSNTGIWLLLLLAAVFIVAVYSVPSGEMTLNRDGFEDYCKCPSCDVMAPCADIVGGKCAACRWMDQHEYKGGRHARH